MPLAAVGETVAVIVKLLPTAVDVLDTANVVVVEVALEELVEEPELEPQPAVERRVKAKNPNSKARKTATNFLMHDLSILRNPTI